MDSLPIFMTIVNFTCERTSMQCEYNFDHKVQIIKPQDTCFT